MKVYIHTCTYTYIYMFTSTCMHVCTPLMYIYTHSPTHILIAEQPDPAEVFTVVRVSETKVALKTGYGRYVSINTAGELTGRAEAIGPRETWEPVFEDVS